MSKKYNHDQNWYIEHNKIVTKLNYCKKYITLSFENWNEYVKEKENVWLNIIIRLMENNLSTALVLWKREEDFHDKSHTKKCFFCQEKAFKHTIFRAGQSKVGQAV